MNQITYIEILIRNSYIPSLIALQGFSGFTVEDPCVVASSGDLLAFSPGLTVFTVLEFVVIVPEPSPVTVSESDVVILPEPSVRSVATVLEFSIATVPEPSVVTVSDSYVGVDPGSSTRTISDPTDVIAPEPSVISIINRREF